MASPYGLDLPGDFDEDQSAIDRRKLQLIAAMKNPIGGAGSGLLGGIGNFLQNAVGTNLLQGQDERARELAGRRDSFARQALEDYGKLDKPAVPEQIGTGPIAPPPGTPGVEPPTLQSSQPVAGETGPPAPLPAEAGWMGRGGMVPQGAEFTPNRAAQPMIPGAMSDKLTALARVAQGGPLYAKVADKVLTHELEAPLEREKAQLIADAKREENLRRYEDRLADNKREERRLEETIRSNQATQEERARANRAMEEIRRDSQRLHSQMAEANAAAGKGTFSPAGSTLEGNPVHINNKTLEQVEIRDGKPIPYTGLVVSKGDEKEVKAAMDLANDARYSESLAKAIAADPKTFGPQANFGTSVSSFFGGLGKEQLTGLTPEQLALRGVIGRDFAETTKQLYGASFTQSEQKRANTFTPQSNDSAEVVMQKLNGAASFSREMAQKYGSKIQQAAAARSGAPAPTSDYIRAQDAKGKWWRRYNDGRVVAE